MQRDNDYLRELLLEIETEPTGEFMDVRPPRDESSETLKRRHHIELLKDARLIMSSHPRTLRMTNQGHDDIAAIRDDGIWERTKEVVRETGGNATVEILKDLAAGFLRKKISHHTGITI